MKNVLWIALALGLSAACGAESETETEEPVIEEPALEEPVEETVVEEPAVEAEASAEELPIAEDFEDEVSEAITADNYDDVLSEIEAELAAVDAEQTE